LLHERNNFPEFTARICPAFCEQACKQGVQASPVSVRVTEGEIVERAFADGWITPQPAETASGNRVAVIGSGPAGLTAAQQLARAGHAVTVFEKDDAPGGLLRYGVPEFRLPKDLLDRRLSQLRAEGVEFRCRAGVGSDVSGEEILREFDAVLLAAGARKAKDLPVPGREQAGVVFAMDYLTDTAPDRKTPLDVRDKTVAVIGGGLTGEDCVETALHAGAKQVVQLEILPKPRTQAGLASPDEMDRVQQYHSVATRQFRGNGSLQELEAVRIRYTPSPKGPIAEEIRDSAFRIPADVAILAVGFDAVVDRALAKQLGLATDEHGKPHVNEYCETNVEGVFAAGDLVTGPSYVATAIASGQRAAEQIHNYLRSK
jgi:NADPH-dependent glutamate synthase beta subunit-like oxidoreductase